MQVFPESMTYWIGCLSCGVRSSTGVGRARKVQEMALSSPSTLWSSVWVDTVGLVCVCWKKLTT